VFSRGNSGEPSSQQLQEMVAPIHGSGVSTANIDTSTEPLVRLSNVSRSHYRGNRELPVLLNTDLEIQHGSFEAIMGPSGSGKTTLLNLIGGIDRPSSGSIAWNGVDITKHSEDELAEWRLHNVGFIFQFYNLVQVLTAFQNVELPLMLSSLSRSERRHRVETALELVGLQDRQEHYPSQLSGGEEQRVSIARAIVTDPQLIVADEPTGDLDRDSSARVVALLGELHRSFGKTIVLVTHDAEVARHAQVIRRIEKGALAPLPIARGAARAAEPSPPEQGAFFRPVGAGSES
jgi:putative ABC transport system ATP-binding protein